MRGAGLRRLWPVAVAVAAVAAVGVYYALDPSASAVFPKCPLLAATGWKCPGCGSQRVVHALLHGDVAAAWGYNALLVAALPVVAVMAAALAGRRRWPALYLRLFGQGAVWSAAAALAAWWLLRNIFGW